MGVSDEPLVLHPTNPTAPRARTWCLYPVVHYCTVYGYSVRAIKGWLATGRAANDMPPLDDPAAMAGWWTRHFEHRVPDRILGAAKVPEKPTEKKQDDAKPAAEPPNYRQAIGSVDDVEGMTLESMMARMRKVIAVNQKTYEKALEDKNVDEATLTLLSRRVDHAVERLRKLETSHIENQKKSGEMVSRTQLASEVTPVLASMSSSLVSRLMEVFNLDRAKALAFADEWFTQLRSTRFLTSHNAAERAAA